MKKNNTQTLEVLEPEVEEIPLEQVIENTLVKHNVTDAVINSLKEKYGSLRLKSIDDKESFLELKDARKNVRSVGILVEKICKKGREDAVAIQRKWLRKEDEIMDRIMEVQLPLDDDIQKFENEVQRKELAEKKRQEEIYINRQTALSRMGASYDNGSYVLNHISYEIELIKAADNDMWNDTIYPKYKKVYEENQTALVEEENKRKLQLETEKKQREEFELQQSEFKKQQELFAQQQAELKKQMDDAEREKRLAVERIEAEERRKKQEEMYMVEMEQQKQAAIQKALDDEKIKQEQEKQQKEIEMAQANDKGKYADVVSYLKQVPKHEMKSSLYKSKMRIIQDFIQDL